MNKTAWFNSEKYELIMPLELANYKSNNDVNEDLSESKSYEIPNSTPEFVETPLISASKQSKKIQELQNSSNLAISTFKRISEEEQLKRINNEYSVEGSNEESKFQSRDQLSSQIQVWFLQILYILINCSCKINKISSCNLRLY